MSGDLASARGTADDAERLDAVELGIRLRLRSRRTRPAEAHRQAAEARREHEEAHGEPVASCPFCAVGIGRARWL